MVITGNRPRLADRVLAAGALVVLSPVMLVAALGIKLSSRGPVFYRAVRVGRDRRVFAMYKFRTMRVRATRDSPITGRGDPRVFAFGVALRRLKIDELPQLWNIVRGEMAIIGPRPEDPAFVDECYRPVDLETLRAFPGLASPGSIYNYTHGEAMLDGASPSDEYAQRLLPIKLALDVVYVRHASRTYDLRIIGRTLWVIACRTFGRRRFPDPPEMAEARRLSHLAPPLAG
jgi:lipopolysaccharide/colanic/teichoic acid biosynthesis glycosyltransferase